MPEQGRTEGDLAAAGAAEDGAEPDEGDGQGGPGGKGVQQGAGAGGKAQLMHQQRRQPHPQQGAGQAVAAAGIIRQGGEKAGVLLHMAVPMQGPAQGDGEKQGQGQQQQHPGCPAAVGGEQGQAQAKAGGKAEADDDAAPINNHGAAVYGDGSVHWLTSREGIAVAK